MGSEWKGRLRVTRSAPSKRGRAGRGKQGMDEQEAKRLYDEMLNEAYPLEGINCNPFSILLREGDPIAYDCGFADCLDAERIELDE